MTETTKTQPDCLTCNDRPFEVTCTSCNGTSCDCNDCRTCTDPATTDCERCDNTNWIWCHCER